MASKIPSTPHAIEAEQALLGSLIMESTSWDKIADKILAADFFDSKNRIIFREITDLVTSDHVIDLLILEESLKSKSLLDDVGGREYLASLTKVVPTHAHITQYAEIIKDIKSPYRMNRLLQGDVGSGKTIVILVAVVFVVSTGAQATLMVPTEVLAIQHFKSFKAWSSN